ncbi:pentapeptide repeat-containing protein [Blastopirellula marina]|uniref:Pentapeptide repeat-containing protein n=1 Tax=Blastopirellula marina TaxID=124 RepID=A0A2S8GEP5_9BACT|nr:pentapeptide repeat-containing protein [Blastopirellula marina]PQO42926.1 hypothetical protein C5Y93_24695 [Blastopirellula marina]
MNVEDLRNRWFVEPGPELRRQLIDCFQWKKEWPGILKDLPGADEIDHYCDLRGIDLTGISLAKCELQYAALDFGRFENCNFGGTDFQFASMKQASFAEANLTLAHMLQVEASGTSFINSDMYRAIAICADFRDCNFSKAHMGKIILDDARCNHASFVDADLTSARLLSCNLSSANLRNARLNDVDLSVCIVDERTILPHSINED